MDSLSDLRQFGGSYLFGMLLAAVFVGMYAFVMARINKAPSTIFLTASVFPLMPGANLYYMIFLSQNSHHDSRYNIHK